MKGAILCEGETLGGEVSLLFSVFNKIVLFFFSIVSINSLFVPNDWSDLPDPRGAARVNRGVVSWRFGKPDRSYGEFGGILEGSQQGDAAFFEGEPYQAQKDVETVLKRHGPTCNEGKVKEPPFFIKKSSEGKGEASIQWVKG